MAKHSGKRSGNYESARLINDPNNRLEEMGTPLERFVEVILRMEYIKQNYPDIYEEAEDYVDTGRTKND